MCSCRQMVQEADLPPTIPAAVDLKTTVATLLCGEKYRCFLRRGRPSSGARVAHRGALSLGNYAANGGSSTAALQTTRRRDGIPVAPPCFLRQNSKLD